MSSEAFLAGFWLGLSTCAALICLVVALALSGERAYQICKRLLAKQRRPRPLPISEWKDLRGFLPYTPERDGPCALCGPEIPSFERWC